MPIYFQRPENALKRANEFIDVGKKQRALDALYDVIKSRKHRTWQKIHEPIMTKYLNLCVELKKSHIAKEGLFQYRSICQQVNIKSLEDVVRGYLQLAEEKTEAAREESQQAVVEIDDLDNVQTPESLLLSAVSSEDTQDRTDRVVLTPWVKFLWESYRQCLELLRNNSRVERLYHDIAQQAFKFCLKYNRKTEFRKLCDNLRAHLGHIHMHQNQQTAVNLNNPESQAMHLETRLVQLDSAIQMELWQEAYKAIEDIHGLMNLSKKHPKPQLMANYYQKLALVFWKAGNQLFHASALFRLFHLSRELKKNITQEDIQRMASRVVLATLSIPMPPNRPEIDRLVETDENVIDKNHRLLSALLSLPNPPTRAVLVKDLVRLGVIQYAPTQLQELYRWLEVEFHPLKLCGRVEQCFDFINKWEDCGDLKQYIPALQDIAIMRLLKEVSQVYQTLEFSRLAELAPFTSASYLEHMVVEAARRNDLQVRIDHRRSCLHFGSELSVSQREEAVEGPHLQGMPSEQIRNQLVQLHSVLSRASTLIQPDQIKASRQELRQKIAQTYHLTAQKEHGRILERQQIIEERKEMLETLNYQKEELERKQLEEQQQKLREAEEERMAREAEERAKQRIMREQDEMKKKVVLEKIEQLKKTELGARIFEGMEEEELEKLDPDEIVSRQVEQMNRERKERAAKLQKQERKMDHLERAKRIEEIPLLQKLCKELEEEDRKYWEEEEEERIKVTIQEREIALQHRDRLSRMISDKDKFLEELHGKRMSVYKEKLAEFQKMFDEEKQRRLLERKETRKKERRETWIKQKEEEEKRKLEEQKRKEEEERQAKLAEIERKKRAREKELEEKMRKQDEEMLALKEKEEQRLRNKPASSREEPAKKPEISKRSWRDREAERMDSWGPSRDNKQKEEERSRPFDREKMRPADSEKSWRDRDQDEDVYSPRRAMPARESRTTDRGAPAADEVTNWRAAPRKTNWRDSELEDRPMRDRDRDRGRDDMGRDRDKERGRGFESEGRWRNRDSDRFSSRSSMGSRDTRTDRDSGGADEKNWRSAPKKSAPVEGRQQRDDTDEAGWTRVRH